MRTITIASPIEPSGASWILNVLLELGVRVRHRPVEKNVFRSAPRSMWIDDAAGARLHPSCSQIEKWMPALLERDVFAFRGDVEVDYTQDLPEAGATAEPAIVFLRDPRDAIYSAYKRLEPALAYDAWLRVPHPRTLLDRPGNWALFARAWLERPGVRALRFEDYKRDDRATFDAALDHLGLSFPSDEIARALAASTFEKAKAGEAKYRIKHPGDRQIANRAGKVGEARSEAGVAEAAQHVERRAADVLARLGYAAGAALEPGVGGAPLALLSTFASVALPEEARVRAAADPLADPGLPALLAFARDVDARSLGAAALPAPDARDLASSLIELGEALASHGARRLERVRADLAEGSPYQMAQLRALVAARRRAKPA
ncbi:MAG TPA: hypothetical protein VGM56_26705 [Byssovorax sp.]